MSTCRRYIKVAYALIAPKEALFTRLRCKQWSCDHCAAKNAREWQYWLIKRLPEVSSEWWLVTLTANRFERTTLASLENLRSNIDKLIKRIKRVFGEDIEYVRVFEKHPTSEAIHVHIVMSGLSPYVAIGQSVKHQFMAIACLTRRYRDGYWTVKTWFKKTCDEMGMGYMADVKFLEGGAEKAAYYVTKYLTKDQQSIDVPYLRHVQVTQGIGKPQFDKSYKWTPVSYVTARTFDEPNTRMTDLDTGEIIDNNYWEVKSHYPYDD